MGKTIQRTEDGSRAKASSWEIFSELVKLRLSALVLITTLVGFYAGLNGETGGLAQNLAKLGLALAAQSPRLSRHVRCNTGGR